MSRNPIVEFAGRFIDLSCVEVVGPVLASTEDERELGRHIKSSHYFKIVMRGTQVFVNAETGENEAALEQRRQDFVAIWKTFRHDL